MRTIFILLDSLNRRYLNVYGNQWVHTPNLSRLAARSAVFDNHWAGSLPCMPARRELMTGRINFLETSWGPIEPFDNTLPVMLRKRGVHSHLITDHYHYFEERGAHYHTQFTTWEFHRGQEGDPWIPQVRDPDVPPHYGKNRRQDWINRQVIRDEADFPGPKCFKSAIDFLEMNRDVDDWFLQLEVFDPHEPFYVPQKYRDMYPDDWNEFLFDWPKYEEVKQSAEAVAHVRKLYAALLTMTDTWLGKFLDKMDELNMWQDTAVILTTDHGYLLGEHGFWAKNYMPVYNEIAHIPLMVYRPDSPANGRRIRSLTATIDLMPTILELHGAPLPPYLHGRSIPPLLEEDVPNRDGVLYGYFGRAINYTDGRYTYFREPVPGAKLYRYTTHATRATSDPAARRAYAKAEVGRFLSHAEGIPVMRIEERSAPAKGALPFNAIYDLESDYEQLRPLRDPALEAELAAKLERLMRECDAPDEQFARVGLVGKSE